MIEPTLAPPAISGRTKVTACIIAYNAEKTMTELLTSLMGHVDHVVIGISSNTTDQTKAEAMAFAGIPTTVYDFPWVDDFAKARNESFAQAPVDTDWLMWIDTDDVFGADVDLHDLLEAQPPEVGTLWVPYLYHRDPWGNVTTMFDRERFFRYKSFPFWKFRLHETCEMRTKGLQAVRVEKVWVDHKNITLDPRGDRNFRILAEMVKDPDDHRAVLYMAHQHFAAAQWEEAVGWYEKYVNLRSPGDVVEEKWQALIYCAQARRNMGDHVGSIKAADSALQLCPQYQDAYHELAHTYAVLRQWDKAIEFHETGLTKKRPDRILIHNPLDYDYNPYAVAHKPYFRKKKYAEALDCVTKCLEMRPDEPEMRWYGQYYLAAWSRVKAIDSQLGVVRYLLDTNQPLAAEKVLSGFTAGADEDNPNVLAARGEVAERLSHLRSPEQYENFYIGQKESVSPKDVFAEADRTGVDDLTVYPRMGWTVKQVKKLGAKKVVEVGVGNAFQSMLMARHGIKVIGLDVDPVRVKQGNNLAVEMGFLKKAPQTLEIPAALKERGVEWNENVELPVMDEDAMVQFHFIKVDDTLDNRLAQLGVTGVEAVVATELIEHVEDLDGMMNGFESLEVPIIMSTPDGSWDGPHSLNTSHVRAWSRFELEREFAKRGQIVQSHLIPHPRAEQPNLGMVYKPKQWNLDRPPVAIFCGPGWEEWGPDSIDRQGLGGSETAVVMLAKELAARSLRVTVYGEAEGVWDGVVYRKHTKWHPQQASWALISWRHPELFDNEIAAQLKYYWVHDVDQGESVTPEAMAKVDAVMCLTEFHKKHLAEKYPFISEKLLIVGNGIDVQKFPPLDIARKSDRFVYTSSPDRGLEQALGYWPEIRKRLPDAEFDIYYGWDNYNLMGGSREFRRRVEALAKQPGVTWRGRVGQEALYKALASSGVWFYPGPHPFEETYCISAVEAQACGVVPVTRDNGALPEVAAGGFVKRNDSMPDKWVETAVHATKMSNQMRAKMARLAKQRTWGRVADILTMDMVNRTKAALEENVPA